MRIAVANSNRRMVGGAETYLSTVIPALVEAGNEIGLVYEVDTREDRDLIDVPGGGPVWCLEEQGTALLNDLRSWKPDVIFAQALDNPAFGTAIVETCKGVFYVHDYYGSCISGAKTHSFPSVRPCNKRFGPACLAHFYPRRCGGLNPILAWKLYLLQRQRLAMLRNYSVIATASDHMRREFINHGFDRTRVRTVSSLISNQVQEQAPTDSELAAIARIKFNTARVSLLFAGRMVPLKGGELLLDALPIAAEKLRKPVDLIFAGDGPARSAWAAYAERLQRRSTQIHVEFRGWSSNEELAALAAGTHLVMMPSLWPEPFGRSGLEIGRWGVPSVAFAVGGIPEWLDEGVTGHLAPGYPATASGLAEGIVRALFDADHYAKLCIEARKRAGAFSVERHIACLSQLFNEVAGT